VQVEQVSLWGNVGSGAAHSYNVRVQKLGTLGICIPLRSVAWETLYGSNYSGPRLFEPNCKSASELEPK
jgi:hypothetical protein